jgi:predicted secreted protein
VTAPAARRAQIQRLRRRLARHERLCAELQTQAQVEAFYAHLMRDRLAGLEAEERACAFEEGRAFEGVERG